jgi:hypothetical protein
VEIWNGEDASLAELLDACLRENRIDVRRSGREPGTLRLFVTAQDETAAREIIREVRKLRRLLESHPSDWLKVATCEIHS